MPKIVAKECLYKEKDVSLHPCKLNNMNTKRTSKAFIVRAAMTLLVMLLTSATAWAETRTIDYITADGTPVTVTANVITEGSDNTLSTGWYVIDDDIAGPLKFNGAVNLIILDNKNVTITGTDGITVNGSLTIYGQSKGTGSLTITANKTGSTSTNGDGINAENGEITINGGILTITATHYGITTYDENSGSNCDITINGGRVTVTATGENGIDATGNITINGGTVTASASNEGTFGMAATGNITLGCTKDTDYIFASSYNKDISINSGLSPLIVYIDNPDDDSQVPTAYNNQVTITSSVINNKIIAPDLFGISKGNTGTSDNPYTISTAGGLQLLATYVNSGTLFDYYDEEDTHAYDVYTGKYFMITDDIIFDTTIENNFTPIGDQFHIFQGTFNGGGHIIRGINIYTDKRYVGLFGHLGKENTAMITNVTLANASIIGNNILYTGGIVGHNNGGSISNCLVANSIINGNSYTGAIAGLNEGTLYHNYYGNSTVNDKNSNVGCGIGSDSSKDVTHNDGAVSATFLSESEDVPSPLNGKVFFYREFTGGSASTICLPFAYNPKNSDGSFYTFNHVEKKYGKWEAIMDNVSGNLAANTPYIFLPDENRNIVPILFHGDAVNSSNPSTMSGNWTFKGTYEEKKWDSEPTGIYGFSAQAVADDNISQGQFVKVGAYVKIRPLRAYLEYTGSNFPNTRSSLPEEGLPDRIIVRLVGGETSIGQLDMKTGQVNFDGGWYNLNGIRLSGKPTKHGIYVHHGKKVVISTMNNE